MRLLSRVGGGAALLVALAALAAPAVARAEGATAKVAAEALFEEGRRLMAEGKAAEACPKFADSQRIDPTPGTLLNLASCYEKTERPATAWATYREAASLAASTGRQDLVTTAQKHADGLSSKLPRLTVSAAAPAPGLAVALDGVTIATGTALPVDPGEHVIEASAPSHKPWSTKITVGPEATTTPVSVPALEAAPAPAAPPPPAPPETSPSPPPAATKAGAASAASAAADEGTERRHGRHVLAIAVGGAGVVALGVGGALGLVAKSKYNDSLASCPHDPNLCTPDGVSQRDTARSMGTAATFVMAAGAAALVGGVVLWATAPSDANATTAARLEVVPALGGAAVKGVW